MSVGKFLEFLLETCLPLLKFSILGALRVFDSAKSIYTIKNKIQALQIPDFLNFILHNSSKNFHLSYSVC